MRIHVNVFDDITPDLNRIAAQLARPRALMADLGKTLSNDMRAHFRMRDQTPNKHGFPRHHFWSKTVRDATSLTEVTDNSATVSVASREYAHKITGGTVTPKTAKALSIPLSGEAYRVGSARLFPRPLTYIKRAGKNPLLVEIGKRQWRLHYVLLKSVTHAPDPNAEPDWGKVSAHLLERAQAMLDRVLHRRG